MELVGGDHDQNTVTLTLNWDLLKQVAQFNDANQIQKKNNTDYQYDADGNTVASYTYDENGLRLTKTVGDTTHEYFYNNEVLDMEVVKKNGEITQYRSYEWDGYTPLELIVKEKDASGGDFQTKTYQFITN